MVKGQPGCAGRIKEPTKRPCLCEIRPIVVESPQERGLATDSGEKLKDEAINVPYIYI